MCVCVCVCVAGVCAEELDHLHRVCVYCFVCPCVCLRVHVCVFLRCVQLCSMYFLLFKLTSETVRYQYRVTKIFLFTDCPSTNYFLFHRNCDQCRVILFSNLGTVLKFRHCPHIQKWFSFGQPGGLKLK